MADLEKKASHTSHASFSKDDGVDRHLQVQMPTSLVGLDVHQLDSIDKKITWKIDLLLLPGLIVLYILNFLDRQNISSAKIGGMTEDLGLTTTEFNVCVSILFVGYISLQIPSNMIASKIGKPGVYICGWTALWGMVSACSASVQSYPGLVVVRLCLGFTEAAFFPGAVFLLSCFYTKKQIALRSAILYSGSQLGNAFGGLLALAILSADGRHGIAGWRWLFIIEGVLTVGCALIFMTFIPNTPQSMKWLTPVERDRLVYRLEADRGTKDATDEMPTGRAFKLAVTDPKVWLLCITLTLAWVCASVTNMFPIVVSQMGFSTRAESLGLTAPPYVLCIIIISLNGWHSDKTHERTFHIVGPFIFCVIANILAVATTNTAARYVSMMLLPASFYAAGITVLSWISSVIVGPAVKRSVAIAIINAISNTSNIWTPYLYYNKPRYVTAFAVNLAAAVLVILCALGTRQYLVRLNKKLDDGEDLGPNGPTAVQIESGFRFQL